MVDILDELKKSVKDEKLVVGTEQVLKGIRDKSIKKVVLSSNVPEDIKDDIEKYTSLTGIPVEKLSMDNEELGTFCKRKFHISVLGLI
ncbi:MAG: ribosomal L7Ae/L30e/S12e/Gadd45 family protein [Candidatus Woesearchaeota archaeon]